MRTPHGCTRSGRSTRSRISSWRAERKSSRSRPGAAGAQLASQRARVQVPAPTVTVRDTVGAGDTFSAGLIDAALRDPSLLATLDEDSLFRLGCHAAAAAAITVQRPGADPPTRQELTRASRAAAVGRCVNGSAGVFAY